MKNPSLPALLLLAALPAAAQDERPSAVEALRSVPAPEAAPSPAREAGRAVAEGAAAALAGAAQPDPSGWTPDAGAMAGLDAAARASYIISSRLGPDGKKEYRVHVTPAGQKDPDLLKERSYSGVTNLRAIGHYITWERGDDAGYQDLLKKRTVTDARGVDVEDFDLVLQIGTVFGTRQASSVPIEAPRPLRNVRREGAVLAHALTRLGMSQEDATLVLQRVARQVGEGEYLVLGSKRDNVIIAKASEPKRSIQVFPAVRAGR